MAVEKAKTKMIGKIQKVNMSKRKKLMRYAKAYLKKKLGIKSPSAPHGYKYEYDYLRYLKKVERMNKGRRF